MGAHAMEVESSRRKLQLAVGLATVFTVGQFIGGFLSGSLAILADSVHMLSDVAGFVVALVALSLSARPASSRFTFGMHRAEVLGALLSLSLIWFITGVLVLEALERFHQPRAINGVAMLATASVGIVLNLVLLCVLGEHHAFAHHGGHRCDGHTPRAGRGASRLVAHDALELGIDPRSGDFAQECRSDDFAQECGIGRTPGHGLGRASTPNRAHARCGVQGGCGATQHAAGATAPGVDRQTSVALRAALAHAMGDLLQSIGVLLAALLIYLLGDRWLDPNGLSYWLRVDPLSTLCFAVLVLASTWSTARDCVLVLMCAVPAGIDANAVHKQLRAIDGVEGVRRGARARTRARRRPRVALPARAHARIPHVAASCARAHGRCTSCTCLRSRPT